VNNVALAARNVVQRFGRKVLILDLDVHHGNGTEEIVFEDPQIAYLSIHQAEWPFTGSQFRAGTEKGSGENFNLPLPIAADGKNWLKAFDKFVVPIVEKLKPFMILVSMGYDTHWRDPQGSMLLSSRDQLELTAKVRSLATNICDGRLVYTLEGGYDRRATASGILNCLADLAGSEGKLIFDAYGTAPQLSTQESRRISLEVDESIAKSLAAYGF
jgi:acetoin utilization deacetylase AcuC-like enzyme